MGVVLYDAVGCASYDLVLAQWRGAWYRAKMTTSIEVLSRRRRAQRGLWLIACIVVGASATGCPKPQRRTLVAEVPRTGDARARAALAENLATTPGAASAEPAAFSREAEPEGIEADASEAQTAEVETVEAERAEAETAEVETVEVENAEAEEPAKPKKRAAAARKPAATAERAPGKKATAKKVAAATAKRAAGKKTAAKATSTTKATATRAPKKTAAKTVKTKD